MTEGFDAGADEATEVEADVAEGQATDQSSSPTNPKWDAYIAEHAVPEPAHNYVRDALRYFDGNVTKEFQKHAEYRSRWEPYEQIEGFDQWEPEQLAQALPLIAALDDEDQAYEVVRRMAEHLGLIEADDGEEADEDDGAFDESGNALDGEPPEWFRQQFEPVQQFVQTMQQREHQQAAQAYIDESFSTIEAELGRKLNADEKADVEDRAAGYATRGEADPIAAAWQAHKGFRTQVERQILGKKRQEPGQAEVGHSAPPASAAPDSRLSLEKQAEQQLRDRIAALG